MPQIRPSPAVVVGSASSTDRPSMYRPSLVSTTHVLTVHWQTPRWLPPQVRNLRRHVPDARIWASLDGVDKSWDDHVDEPLRLEGNHAEKLNELAVRVAAIADRDDRMLFIDGDALPIAPIDADRLLDGVVLAAVRRGENLGDPQPHPCFCLTTVGAWSDIGGDWREGHQWRNSTGDLVTDVGGELLRILDEGGLAWRPLVRSNRWNPDPLLFGVYGDVVYHHGAGFRVASTRRLDAQRRARRARARRVVARVPAGPARGATARLLNTGVWWLERRDSTKLCRLEELMWRHVEADDVASVLARHRFVGRLRPEPPARP